MKTASELVEETASLPRIPPEAAQAYRAQRDAMVLMVNRRMEDRSDIARLIGGRVALMRDNHRNHAAFMDTVFSMNNYRLLVRVVPWVYRAYRAHGFSYDYFPVELESWVHAVGHALGRDHAHDVNRVYHWMVSHHEDFVALAEAEEALFAEPEAEGGAVGLQRERFFHALVAGDVSTCLAIANEVATSDVGVEGFYLQVVQPLMTRVGTLWENGHLSVAQEHLASSIVSRVMAALYASRDVPTRRAGTAMVTSAMNEFHEIGAWMVADLLELKGWKVTYLGANTPVDECLTLLRELRPDVLAVSVTMPFNLVHAKSLIETIRKDPAVGSIKIMVGGPLFSDQPDLIRELGADGSARDAAGACTLAASWLPQEKA